jgi:hypothetical protein
VLSWPDIGLGNDALSTGNALLLQTFPGRVMNSPRTSLPPENRAIILERAAVDAAQTWTDACFAALAQEGRRIDGGWPGTMREARTRAAAEATKALQVLAMSVLTHDELDRLAQTTYEKARRAWLRSSRDGSKR